MGVVVAAVIVMFSATVQAPTAAPSASMAWYSSRSPIERESSPPPSFA